MKGAAFICTGIILLGGLGFFLVRLCADTPRPWTKENWRDFWIFFWGAGPLLCPMWLIFAGCWVWLGIRALLGG
jgi:hypothetical protein